MMEVIRLHCSTMTDNFSVFAQKYYIFAIPWHLILLLFTVMNAYFYTESATADAISMHTRPFISTH